jgi:hypothetical protein
VGIVFALPIPLRPIIRKESLPIVAGRQERRPRGPAIIDTKECVLWPITKVSGIMNRFATGYLFRGRYPHQSIFKIPKPFGS